MKISITILCLLHVGILYGQPKNERVKFYPGQIRANSEVRLEYSPDSIFSQKTNQVYVRVYFTRRYCFEYFDCIGDDPIVEIVQLTKHENGRLQGAFFVNPAALGVVAVFMDSLGNIDNNKGEGYWTPVYGADGKPLPGSFSSIAELYVGGWNPRSFYLTARKDKARELYEKDFALHPEVKRQFTRYYLNTFNLNDTTDRALFKKELDRYAQYEDLTEWELKLGVSMGYRRLGDTLSAKRYMEEVRIRYPNGSVIMQKESLKLAMSVAQLKGLKQKEKGYRQYKELYSSGFPDEFTRRVMTGRREHILSYILKDYLDRGKQDEWLAEVEDLEDKEFIYGAYGTGARRLMEYGVYPEVAQILFQKTIQWLTSQLDAPRRLVDVRFYTDEEIRAFREDRIATEYGRWGKAVLRQTEQGLQSAEFYPEKEINFENNGSINGKGTSWEIQSREEQAHALFREAAITWGKRKSPELNESYIQSLVRTNRKEEAIAEAREAIRLGASTKAIREYYDQHVNNAEGLTEIRAQAISTLSENLKDEMLHTQAPQFDLANPEGNTLSSDSLLNKIVVIDFWATWCPPCVFDMNAMEQLTERYKDRNDIVFLLVNVKENNPKTARERALGLVAKKNLTDALYFDLKNKMALDFDLQSLPTLYVIDRNGNIAFRNVGTTFNTQKKVEEVMAMIELADEIN